MVRGGNVFTNFDVPISGKDWLKGVKLIETSTRPPPPTPDLSNRVFKIMLLNT